MNIEKWRSDEKTVTKSKRYYAHFDYRTDISRCWEYISDRNNIVKHGFYPFIHYEKHTRKYAGGGKRKDKVRDICYAAHIDRCIFQYYNFLLSELYNERVTRLGLNEVAVAYRNNFNKKSNIDFANAAFRFLIDNKNDDKENTQTYVMIGDFTRFFDNLDHKYLKEQWRSLLGVDKLPADHYAVYKNITRFSYVELTDLLRLNELADTTKGRRELNRKAKVLTTGEFRENKDLIQRNEDIGVPQGSPISGVLANIYMLEIDRTVHDYVTKLNGKYMRYSDDFIIILPNLTETEAVERFKRLSATFNGCPGLELQPEKTQYYCYTDDTIVNCGDKIALAADTSNRRLAFLGFVFDGKTVNLRDKTVSKFYYRMRKKAKTIVLSRGITSKGTKISKKNLYNIYSIKSLHEPGSNFLKYARRAGRKFAAGSVDEQISAKVLRRNMFKVNRFLNKKYNLSDEFLQFGRKNFYGSVR